MDVDWGFDFPVPHFTTVRLWLLRLGHYNLTRPKEQGDDWVWIIDHSNQIGQEKCLMILGVAPRNCRHRGRLPALPEPDGSDRIGTRHRVGQAGGLPAIESECGQDRCPARSSVTTVATWPVALSCSVRSIRRRSTLRHHAQGGLLAQGSAGTG